MEKLNLVSEQLLIRNLEEQDLMAFYSYRSKPEVMKYQGSGVMNLAEAEAFIDNQKDKFFGKPGEWVQYAIADKTTNQLLGDCAIKLDVHEPRIATVGMTIAPENQQKGYAKQAFNLILTFLFEKQNVHRVVELVAAKNVASIRLLQSMEFREEGYFRESYFDDGQWESEYQYAMLKAEWEVTRRLLKFLTKRN